MPIKVPTRSGLSLKQVKAKLKSNRENSGGGQKDFKLIILGDEDEARIRLLENPGDWVYFGEHYVGSAKPPYIPCIGEKNGCTICEDGPPSERAIANVYVYQVHRAATGKRKKEAIEKVQGVRLLKLNKAQQTSLMVRYTRRDTIIDRDVDLIRNGADQDTTYTIEWADTKSKIPSAAKGKKHDAQAYLTEIAEGYFGKGKKKRSTNKKKSRDEDDDEEDEWEDSDDSDDDEDDSDEWD